LREGESNDFVTQNTVLGSANRMGGYEGEESKDFRNNMPDYEDDESVNSSDDMSADLSEEEQLAWEEKQKGAEAEIDAQFASLRKQGNNKNANSVDKKIS